MPQKLPVLPLKKHERILLEEVYKRNFEGDRFNFIEVWLKVQDQLPDYFRATQMDKRLISENGEKIKVMGVMALQKNSTVIKKIDKMMGAIWQIILEDPKAEMIQVSRITVDTGLSEKEASFLFHIVDEITQYHTGSNNVENSLQYSSISVKDNLDIYQKYKEFPGIVALVISQLSAQGKTPLVYFNEGEIIEISQRLDQLKEAIIRRLDNHVQVLEEKQRTGLQELHDELDELKPLLHTTPKKLWYETLVGKMTMKGLEKIAWDYVLPKFIELGKPLVKGFLHYLNI